MSKKEDVRKDTYSVVVDYTKTLAEMVWAGNYDLFSDDFNNNNSMKKIKFSGSSHTKVVLELVLVHFNKPEVGSSEVLAEMKLSNLRPATLPELLAVGTTYPELQRQFQIIALGFAKALMNDNAVAPYLSSDCGKRKLGFDYYPGYWHSPCCFLAVAVAE